MSTNKSKKKEKTNNAPQTLTETTKTEPHEHHYTSGLKSDGPKE